MRQTEVTSVEPHEINWATAVLTLAFADDPVARWLYPTAERYLVKFPLLIRAFGKEALDQGTARLVADGMGAALWLPPPLHPDEEALGAVLQQDIPEDVRDDANALFAQMDSYHPSEPYWYLPLIGIDPTSRGKGYGSLLLEEALVRCDQDRVQVYLDSTNPRNVPLYEKYGFKILGTIQAGAAPPVFPMLRSVR